MNVWRRNTDYTETNGNPLVSVGIPVYNEEAYIGSLLESVLRQDCGNVEILIGDNASTDGTMNIVKHMCKNDSRITLLGSPVNNGPLWNFDRLLRGAKGKYFIFAGAHDRWGDADMLSSTVSLMEADGSILLSSPVTHWMDELGQELQYGQAGREKIDTRYARNPVQRARLLYEQMDRCSIVYGLHRRDSLLRTWPWKNGNDTRALLLIASQGNIVTNPNAQWYRRVVRRDNVSSANERYGKLPGNSFFARYFFLLNSRIEVIRSVSSISGPMRQKLSFQFRLLRDFFGRRGQLRYHSRVVSEGLKRMMRDMLIALRRLLRYGKPACNVCGYKGEFAESGIQNPIIEKYHIIGAGRRRVRCPVCGSSDRERLVYYFLKDWLKEQNRGIRVLHIAPERNIAKLLTSHPEIEYLWGDIKYPEGGANHVDILSTAFENESFDLIVCNHVLEHVRDDAQAMKEILRILKRAGIAILQVPFSEEIVETLEEGPDEEPSPTERLKRFGQEDHVRIYGPDYVDRLTKCGFRVDCIRNRAIAARFLMNSREPLFIARKSDKV